ncbi:hypothetical protein SAMN04487950_0316 [Halogranum rubrum]|uniref:DUF7344 domain-containing protein n=1 Tax=Halogranum rubrum TaxID=553466 RepID=A0A1I4B758_9EURY|nr:hypothetical protein [Halogranum rubrum]SFK63831.1 hypothetical protein SAMN04487950_0316 [Halogranum rubrum]
MTEHTDDTTDHSESRLTQYRRLIVDRLCEHTTLTVADLADEIAVHQHDAPLDDVPPTAVVDIYTELCRTHLPELARASLVAYDEEHELVSRPGCGLDTSVPVSECQLPSTDDSESS